MKNKYIIFISLIIIILTSLYKSYYPNTSLEETFDNEEINKNEPWCNKMISTYSTERMTTYPYPSNFGVDGPNGRPLWGSNAEKVWKNQCIIKTPNLTHNIEKLPKNIDKIDTSNSSQSQYYNDCSINLETNTNPELNKFYKYNESENDLIMGNNKPDITSCDYINTIKDYNNSAGLYNDFMENQIKSKEERAALLKKRSEEERQQSLIRKAELKKLQDELNEIEKRKKIEGKQKAEALLKLSDLDGKIVTGVIKNGRGLYFSGLPINKNIKFQASKDGIKWYDFANFNTNTGKPTSINNPFITLGSWWSCTPGTGNCSGVVYAKSGTQTDYKYRSLYQSAIINEYTIKYKNFGNKRCKSSDSYNRFSITNVDDCKKKCTDDPKCNTIAIGPTCVTYNNCIMSSNKQSWGYDYYQKNNCIGSVCYNITKAPRETVGKHLNGSGKNPWPGSVEKAVKIAYDSYGNKPGITLRYIQNANGRAYFYGGGNYSGRAGSENWRIDSI